jgi:hypothetical protein
LTTKSSIRLVSASSFRPSLKKNPLPVEILGDDALPGRGFKHLTWSTWREEVEIYAFLKM